MTMTKGSKSYSTFKRTFKHAENLFDTSSPSTHGRGRPYPSHLFASATQAYASWEAYIEDLAIESVGFLSKYQSPESISDEPVKSFTQKKNNAPYTPWELIYNPGWKNIWVERITLEAKGDGISTFGINNANESNINKLFSRVDIPLWENLRRLAPDSLDLIQPLIEHRGAIVHTGAVDVKAAKSETNKYLEAVKLLVELGDCIAHGRIKRLTKKEPWRSLDKDYRGARVLAGAETPELDFNQ